MKRSGFAFVMTAVLVGALVSQASSGAAAARPRVVAGVGVWSVGGRTSTLEMVGLNPQPEPPSRVLMLRTGGGVAVITVRCARVPAPRTLVATGRGSDGLWYAIQIVDGGVGSDRIGVAALSHPPNPCDRPPRLTDLTAGDFLVR